MALNNKTLIAVIDDEAVIRESVAALLESRGYKFLLFENAEDALKSEAHNSASCMLVDLKLPGMDGVEFLKNIGASDAPCPVIIMSGHGEVGDAVNAMRLGAYDFIEKPFERDVMLSCISRAVEVASLRSDNKLMEVEIGRARQGYETSANMIGGSKGISEVRRQVNQLADSDTTVLIQGETGVGKELVAHALHDQSSRINDHFVAINLAAFPEALALGELFGYEKGAFTGADQRREGKFEHAAMGTLFLDEINSAPQSAQVALLRAIEEKKITRLGGNSLIDVDVRIVTATNQNLAEYVDRNEFRADLYHRLNVASIHVPPLRERSEDIPLLSHNFLRRSAMDHKKNISEFSSGVMETMMEYSWPGNVRELKNSVESMVLASDGEIVTSWEAPKSSTPTKMDALTFRDSMEKHEKSLIIAALQEGGGFLNVSAELLDLPPRSLFDKMRKFGLRKEDFR